MRAPTSVRLWATRAVPPARSHWGLIEACGRFSTSFPPTPHRCMSWGPDSSGVNGVYLSKDVIKCAGGAIKQAVTKVWGGQQGGGVAGWAGQMAEVQAGGGRGGMLSGAPR